MIYVKRYIRKSFELWLSDKAVLRYCKAEVVSYFPCFDERRLGVEVIYGEGMAHLKWWSRSSFGFLKKKVFGPMKVRKYIIVRSNCHNNSFVFVGPKNFDQKRFDFHRLFVILSISCKKFGKLRNVDENWEKLG